MAKKGKKGKDKKKKKQKEPKEPVEVLHHGTGAFQMENGDLYEGEYTAHRCGLVWREGKGVYTTHDGQIYSGEWKDDKLIENSEIVIEYPNGHCFYGRLTKGKYNGPGVYTTRPDIVITAEFVNNKPSGDVILIDKQEDLWFAIASTAEDSCIFQLQNYFFENITEDRGTGIPKIIKYPKIGKSKHILIPTEPTEEAQIPKVPSVEEKKSAKKEKEGKGKKKGKKKGVEEVEPEPPIEEEKETEEEMQARLRRERVMKIFNREKEQKIFAKTMKTAEEYQYTETSWYQDYLKFQVTKEKILEKLAAEGVKSLTKEEKRWCREYKRFLEINSLRDIVKELEAKKKVDSKLLETYTSDEFNQTREGIKCYYPRKDWDMFFDKNGEFWNKDYVPAKRSKDDVFDDSSSCSSCRVRKLLKSSSGSASDQLSTKSFQTNPAIEHGTPPDLVEMVAKEKSEDSISS